MDKNKLKIAIIDSDKDFCRKLRNKLKREFYLRDYKEFKSTDELIEHFENEVKVKPDLFIFGGSVADIRVTTLIKIIRNKELANLQYTPIICISDKDKTKDLVRFMNAGADDCLSRHEFLTDGVALIKIHQLLNWYAVLKENRRFQKRYKKLKKSKINEANIDALEQVVEEEKSRLKIVD